MAKKVALLFAGQGAQVVGMGKDLADQFPVVANVFRCADEILGRKLSDIAWNGPLEELTKTSNCQPALFVHGLACLSVLRELGHDFPIGGAAGLSLGELTAHAAAGTFEFEDGLRLVQKRGELMDEACASTVGGMAAMIGADENAVRQLADDEDVDVANINSPGQIVISGELAKVEAAVAVAKEHGIRRATLLNVAGAFRWQTVADGDPAAWDLLFSVNVKTTPNSCRAAIPHLRASRAGRIVNVGAYAALKAGAGMGAYTASKAGVHRLTEALAAEHKGKITVNAVLPSTIDTAANRADMPKSDFSKWVTPQELAEVILFLVSDAASAVTGALIPVAGRV